MSDAPIYERLAAGDKLNPLRTERRPLIVNDEVVTTPVSADVARAMHELEIRYFEAMVEALAPFNLHPYAIAQPRYERIVYRHEFGAVPPHPLTVDLWPAIPEERSDEQPPQEP